MVWLRSSQYREDPEDPERNMSLIGGQPQNSNLIGQGNAPALQNAELNNEVQALPPPPPPPPQPMAPQQQQPNQENQQLVQPPPPPPIQPHVQPVHVTQPLAAQPVQQPYQQQPQQMFAQHPPPGFVHRQTVPLKPFSGQTSAVQWWHAFMAYATMLQMTEAQVITSMPCYLEGIAQQWYFDLPSSIKTSTMNIREALIERFRPSALNIELQEIKQGENENVEDYIHRVKRLCADSRLDDFAVMTKAMKGLRPAIGGIVIPQDPVSVEDLRKKCCRAETTIHVTKIKPMEEVVATMQANMKDSFAQLANSLTSSINAMTQDSYRNKQTWDDRKPNFHQDNLNQRNQMGHPQIQRNFPQRNPGNFRNGQNSNMQNTNFLHRQDRRENKFHGGQFQQQYGNGQMWKQQQQYGNGQMWRQQQQCKGCGKLWTLLVSFIYRLLVIETLLMVLPSCAASNVPNLVQRINYGVLFKKDSHMYMAEESWLHTFQVQIPSKLLLPKISYCTNKENKCHSVNSMINFIHSLHDSTEVQLLETISAIHSLVPQTKLFDVKRSERSLLPFIGSLAKGIFGLATMDDVTLLAKHINALNSRTRRITQALQQHGAHLSSFISLMDNRTSNLMHGIQENSKEIKQVAHLLYSNLENFEHSFGNMSKIMVTLVNNANILRENLNQLYSSIQSLVEGQISPFLIPKHQLTHTLHKIQKILTDSYPGFYLTHFNPAYYYAHADFFYTRNHSSIFVTLRFQVSSRINPFNLYKIITLPVPINKTSMHATKLMTLPSYLVISPQNDFYTTLSHEDLTDCKHGPTTVCKSNMPLTPFSVQSCSLALFNNNVKLVNQLCNFRFLTNHLTHNIVELTPTKALVYQNDGDLTLTCPEHKQIISTCSFCIVDIPCKCSLTSHTLFLSPRLVNCHDEGYVFKTKNFSVVHPVNLALLTQFFDEKKLDGLLGDTTFSTPVTLDIPNFNIYTHNISNILAADQSQHLSLQKMAQAAQKDQMIFKTLTEPLLTGDINVKSNWPDTTAILVFVALSIASFTFLVCLYLFIKMRHMATAMFVLQQVSKAKGQTVPSFIFHPITTATKSKTNIMDVISTEFSWIHASVVTSILVLFVLIIILIYICRSKSKQAGTRIVLEITSGGDCVIVPLTNLSLCPSYWQFSNPFVQEVRLSSFPYLQLFTIWSNFHIKNKLTDQSIAVPTSISIDFITWYKLRTILQQPFCAYVLLVHNGFASMLVSHNKQTNANNESQCVPSILYPELPHT